MGKKKTGCGGDLSKNKKGVPLYSREDIREQYCINEKELHVLDKNQRRSFLGCFTNHNQGGISPCSGGRNKKSLLGSCIARTSSEEDFHKKYEDNLPPPLSPGVRSTSTWNARARMYHYGGGYHGVDEEDGFDEHYFRRRPKSFCMLAGPPPPPLPQYLHPLGGYRVPLDPSLRLSMGSLVEPGEPLAYSGGAHTLNRICSNSSSQVPPSSSVQVGHPLPAATNYYGVNPPLSGNYAIPHGYYPIYSSKEIINERTQPNTPDLLMHRRQQSLMESSKGVDTSKSMERLIDNGIISSMPPPPNMPYAQVLNSSQAGDCMYGDTLITQEMARQVMIDRIKRNSMRTQATQTDVNRGLRAELIPGNKGPPILSLPHSKNITMISEGVQTNGILKPPPPYYPPPPPVPRHHQQPSPTEIPGYKLQIYEIDTLPPDDAETQSPSFSPSNPHPPSPLPPKTSVLDKRRHFVKSRSEGEILEGRESLQSLPIHSYSSNNLVLEDSELPELAPIEEFLHRGEPEVESSDSPPESIISRENVHESSSMSEDEGFLPTLPKGRADIVLLSDDGSSGSNMQQDVDQRFDIGQNVLENMEQDNNQRYEREQNGRENISKDIVARCDRGQNRRENMVQCTVDLKDVDNRGRKKREELSTEHINLQDENTEVNKQERASPDRSFLREESRETHRRENKSPEQALLRTERAGHKKREEMTLSLGSDPSSSNSLIWQRGISNGEVQKKKKAIEEQIQSQSAASALSRSSSIAESPLGPASSEDVFKDYERTPIQTPEEFVASETLGSSEDTPEVLSLKSEEKGANEGLRVERSSGLVVEPPMDFADSPVKTGENNNNNNNAKTCRHSVGDKSTPPITSNTIRKVRSRSRSRSKERLLAKMAGAAEAPIVSYDEKDDVAGLYSGNYTKASWAFLGGMNKSYMEEPPRQMARSSSIESTQSERDFKRRHQAITHRMVHRRSSALMYSRILERSFECNKTVNVQRIRGEFGFRIHGSRPVVISAIEPDTPAQRSGLEVGDIILSINGVNVLDLPHTEVVRTAQTGSDELELGLARVNEESPTSMSESSMEKLEESLKVICTGYLWKMSRDETKRWIRRWFVLRADSCFYFFKSDRDSRPLGVHLLADSSLEIDANDTQENTYSYSFKISLNISGESNTLDLAAESLDELNRWSTAISEISKKTLQDDFWLDIVNQRLSLPCQEFPGKIDASGYLLKLDSQSKSWKKRYCLLCDSCLYLFSENNSKSAIASLCLHGYKVQSTASLGGNKRHAFELMPPLKSLQYFYFVAETETEKKRWLASLEYSLDCWIKVS